MSNKKSQVLSCSENPCFTYSKNTIISTDHHKKPIFDSYTVKKTKWSFIDWNNEGIPRLYNEAKKNVKHYLKNEILKINFQKLFKNGFAPPLIEIRKLRWDFYIAIKKRKFSYSELIDSLGLKIYKKEWHNAKWVNFDWNISGFPRTREDALENIKFFFQSKIFTRDFKLKFNLSNNDAPTRSKLEKGGYKSFLIAIYKKGFTYNEMIDSLGLKINRHVKKYSKFNWNNSGFPRSYKMAVSNATKYLLNDILTSEFKKKYNLGEYEAPTSNFFDNKINSFAQALWRRNISYNDVLEEGDLIPHNKNIYSIVGTAFHWIAELIFLRNSDYQGCISFYESYPSRLNETFQDYHCDNTIIVDENFRNLSKHSKNIPKNIKLVNIDYYLGTTVKKIINKSQKGYQDKNKMLILVPINSKKPISTPYYVPYREHVRVLDPISFSLFFGYKNNINNLFLNYVNLAKKATYNSDCRLKLVKIAEECKFLIKKNFNFKQKELEGFLEMNRDIGLLNYNFD
ncbi:MAG: hypothetical protein ACFFBP_01290 [Promethearchaeota archaeon]